MSLAPSFGQSQQVKSNVQLGFRLQSKLDLGVGRCWSASENMFIQETQLFLGALSVLLLLRLLTLMYPVACTTTSTYVLLRSCRLAEVALLFSTISMIISNVSMMLSRPH